MTSVPPGECYHDNSASQLLYQIEMSSRAFSVTERARVCRASGQGHNLGTREPELVRVFPLALSSPAHSPNCEPARRLGFTQRTN